LSRVEKPLSQVLARLVRLVEEGLVLSALLFDLDALRFALGAFSLGLDKPDS
jgi:hypothetical protein